MFPASAVCLLFLLLAINSAAGDIFTDAGLVRVTDLGQLWRFQVGPSGVDRGVTPGDDYICLRDWKGKFVRGTPEGPYNDRRDCFTHERFIVKILAGNLVSIQRNSGKYLQCKYPDAGASATVDVTTKFMLFINSEEDELYVYNPYHGVLFGADYDNHLLSCSSDDPHASQTFYGWKKGSKEDWTAVDKWVFVGTYDNRKSKSAGRFTYWKTVGLEQSPTTDACGSVAVRTAVGACFGKFFSSRVVSSAVGLDWSRVSSATWSTPTTTTDFIEVPPGVATAVYQAVGTYGTFSAKSNHFRVADWGSSAKETLSTRGVQQS